MIQYTSMRNKPHGSTVSASQHSWRTKLFPRNFGEAARASLFAALLLGVAAIDGRAEAATGDWLDTYYQYRIPLDVKVDKPGWVVIPVDEKMVTDAVNKLEEMKYRGKSFAYNYVKVAAKDQNGSGALKEIEAGFYLIETGPDLISGWADKIEPSQAGGPMFEGAAGVPPPGRDGDSITVAVQPNEFYLLRYTTSGASSPSHEYEPIHPEGSELSRNGYRISYETRLLPLTETTHETLIQPDNNQMRLDVGGRFVNTPKSMSLRRAHIVLLANLPEAGNQRLDLYYQPMGAHYLMVPEKRREKIPEATAHLVDIGPAQKFEGPTRYLLAENDRIAVWFAASTVKMTPTTPVPERTQSAIRLTAARNERISAQVVLSPFRAWRFEGIKVSDLTSGANKLASDRITVRAVDYVPIRKESHVNPTDFKGWVGDPLVPVTPKLLTPEEGNQAFWITVDVSADTVPGTYKGNVHCEGGGDKGFDLPMELTVHNFTLPEFSPLQTNVGGQFFLKSCINDQADKKLPLLVKYHGAWKTDEVQKLANAHYEVMARNKFFPKSVALYTPLRFKWDPPPEGMNVDKPGNYFRLYDWDFTEYNKQLDYFINKLKVNQFCIFHSNPTTLNIFQHLPGKEVSEIKDLPFANAPSVTYAWQSFTKPHFVGYGIEESHSFREWTKDITRDQYDHLVLDFFRAIAENLEKHGWLDRATILIDERHNDERLKHFLTLLKSDPLTAKIKVGACVQSLNYFTDAQYRGLFDYYIPQSDEGYNRSEDFYFTDYGIKPDRQKLWNYLVGSSRLVIDTPGINNRELGLDLWQRGAGGYLNWDTYIYEHAYGDRDGNTYGHSGNPWADPYTVYGNGALSFFYPPRRDGSFPDKADFTVTPSLRMEIHREAVNDYEYAWLLNNLVEKADKQGIDTSKAKAIADDLRRFFHNQALWSQNDA
jgi:hypothetical protein